MEFIDEILILSTAGSEELASRIGKALVEENLAACVNIVPGIRSVYRWQGRICEDAEFLMLIKSSANIFEQVRRKIREIHTYQVPEIIALPLGNADGDYLSWLRGQLRVPD
jgi:periplasmic divalent cation tolerance protein